MNRPQPPKGPRPGPNASSSRRPRRGPPPGARPQNPAGGRPAQKAPRKRKDETLLFADDASTAQRLNEQKKNEPPRPQRKAKANSSASRKPKPKQTSPLSRARKKPKAFEIRKGEYFDKNESSNNDEELTPLSEITLPRSLIEEDEEKAFRKKFGKDEDDSFIDIYSGERHGAVKVTHSKLEDDDANKSSRAGKGLIILIIVLAISAGAIYALREPLRPHFQKMGIQLPK